MDKQQQNKIDELQKIDLLHSKEWLNYWQDYSSFGHWQFWVVLALLIIPLIFLLIFINKRKALLLCFYGYNVHVFFTYVDVFGASKAYWFYPYKVLPILPASFTLDVSFVPVTYILWYQWILKNNKNYYLYMFVLSLIFAFIFKPLLVAAEFFQLNRGANFFHLFIGYYVVAICSKLVTNLFIYLQNLSKNHH
ncbi:CBO0543 family protein [Metabacillus sp. YM-086]|uniref:CBO0543 family protein n=1 Tax=Metabacillus sp. YM-086 TaxID=3341729 RepID=UPI001B9CA5D3